MKFVQLILRKIIKIVATRCRILRLKCTKFNFGWGSAPDPAGGAYSAPPDPLAGFEGPTSKGGKEKGRGWELRGEGRRRREAFLVMWPRRLSALNQPLTVAFTYSKFKSAKWLCLILVILALLLVLRIWSCLYHWYVMSLLASHIRYSTYCKCISILKS